MMEYLEGVKKAKTLEIGELLVQAEGTEVKVNGAVHTIRDMGNVACDPAVAVTVWCSACLKKV